MNPRWRAAFQILFLIGVLALLFALFPRATQFVEQAARELRYFWWVILLIALAIWLIWGIGRKRK